MERQGLIGTNQDMRTLGEPDVFETKVCKMFGAKFDKNGWKFKIHTNKEIQNLIIDLYKRVYEKRKDLNDTITLEFVHTLIAQNNGVYHNWAAYALVAHEKRVSLQSTKEK